MKRHFKAFGIKLWIYFILFAAVILLALWLLQTVFLQNFYDSMAVRNVKSAAAEICAACDSDNFETVLDNAAGRNSFLIFLTDKQGNILYATDEHSKVYRKDEQTDGKADDLTNGQTDIGNQNRPRDRGVSGGELGWQLGARRNLSLPQGYDIFLKKLSESENGTVGYRLEDSASYVYGMTFPDQKGDQVLYISMQLGAVGSTVRILRTQLIWVTAASLLLASLAAFFIARRFARPVSLLSEQARSMAAGGTEVYFEKGFCSELDGLAETLSQTADELARTEQFRREFLANISHDLRTPLTMIRGYAEMVRDISWEDEKERETDLNVIIREADRLTGLVNDILEYTALQAGAEKTMEEIVDISDSAGKVIRQFEPLCLHNGYEIRLQAEPGLMVKGNDAQLSRVLYNLIDNAVSHAGGDKRVQIIIWRKENTVRVEIRDFGKGIPSEDLPYIWERYFTLKQRKRNEKGSGLGLAISREILQAHGAEFGVESEEGKGSMFWFELPGEIIVYSQE